MSRGLSAETAWTLAVLLIGFALQLNDGLYSTPGLVLLSIAAVLSLAGLILSRARLAGPSLTEIHRSVTSWGAFTNVAVSGLAVNLYLLWTSPAGIYVKELSAGERLVFKTALVLVSGAIGMIAWDTRRARRVWFPAALVGACILGVWMIHVSPDPRIDVVTVHHQAIAALTTGASPYAITFPNIYDGDYFYAQGATQGGTVLFGFPYPPLSLLMAIPGQLALGDFRYAELAALIVGAALIGLGPRSKAPGQHVAPLAAALLLFTPRILFVLEQGWTETLAVCWLGAVVYTGCRAPKALPWTLALLVSVKQHLVLAMPSALVLLPRPFSVRSTIRLLGPSVVLPVALAAPFLVWNANAFIQSAILLQLREPFRSDSLSLLGGLAAAGFTVANHPTFILLLSALAIAVGAFAGWVWAERSLAGFNATLGLLLLLVFLVGKKAFCNYYFLVIAVFCAAIAARSDRERSLDALAATGSREPA